MLSRRLAFPAFVAAMALVAVSAAAQAPTVERGYVMGIGGAAMTDVTSPLFGGGVGFNVGPYVQITGEVGRMNDVQAPFTNEDLQVTANEANASLPPEYAGYVLTAKTSIPTVFAMAGARVLIPTNGPVRPYVLGSGGVAHLMPEPAFAVSGLGDITNELFAVVPGLQNRFKTDNRPIASVGGGISTTIAKHFIFDVGYKYSRVFIPNDYLQSASSPHQHTGINVHRAYVGAGYAF